MTTSRRELYDVPHDPATTAPHDRLPIVPSAAHLSRRIEADVLLGRLQPGAWLRLVDMEHQYGASRFEVRAAFTALAAIGILEHVPNRGFRVIETTDDELRQRVGARLLLEVPAVTLVAGRATGAELTQLRDLARQFEWAIEHAELHKLDLANHAFHRAFFYLCGNPSIEQLINELRERPRSSGWQHWKTVSRNRDSATDHFALVDAVEAGDEARLRRLAWRHILRSGPPPLDEVRLAHALGIDDVVSAEDA